MFAGKRTKKKKAPAPSPYPIAGQYIQPLGGPEDILVSKDGQACHIGANWWELHGKDLLVKTREQFPDATVDETARALLGRVMPTVDWEQPGDPGARLLKIRVKRLIEREPAQEAPLPVQARVRKKPAAVQEEPSAVHEEPAEAPGESPAAEAPTAAVLSPEEAQEPPEDLAEHRKTRRGKRA